MDNISEKIKKLLRLAGSDNEYEAKLALMRARKLMAEYKLDIKDFDESNKEVIEVITDFYYTDYKDGYRLYLSQALAERYCCVTYQMSERGSKCKFITFRGYEEDVKVLCNVFKYADDCIRSWFFKHKKTTYNYLDNKNLNAIKNDYGIGFSEGLAELLDEQMKSVENQEWGLVMVVPQEAKNYVDKLNEVDISLNMGLSDNIQYIGKVDGYNSNLHDKLMTS